MNVAGRKIVVSISIPGRPGLQLSSACLDAAGHVEGVGPRELLDDEHQARAVVDDGVADQRLVVAARGRRHRVRGTCACRPAARRARPRGRSGRDDRRDVLDREPLVGGVDEATGADDVLPSVNMSMPGVERAAVASMTWFERDAAGGHLLGHRPGPGAASAARPRSRRSRRRGRSAGGTGSSSRRSSTGRCIDSVSDDRPIFIDSARRRQRLHA